MKVSNNEFHESPSSVSPADTRGRTYGQRRRS